ncbi:hypothetical protein [Allosalinactinospora lopnorensis]|nr:hypothetical protein [Allosalinactinospora lopnorensis]
MDDDPAPHVYARLSTDVCAGTSQIGTSQLSDHDTVFLTIALTSR